MKKTLFYTFFCIYNCGCFIGVKTVSYFIYEVSIDRTPNSNPFKINPNITFKSIVKNGFSYDNNEYGDLIYSKKNKDTIIGYTISIPLYNSIGYDENDFENIFLDSDENPYKSLDVDKIIYHKIFFKHYIFKIGDSLNLKKTKAFIAKNEAVITLEEWSKFNSGILTIYNPKENISFNCYIELTDGLVDELGEAKWYFYYSKQVPNNFVDNIYECVSLNWSKTTLYAACITSFLLFSFLIVKTLKSKKKTFYKWNLLIFVIYLILFLHGYFSISEDSEIVATYHLMARVKLDYITKVFYTMIFHFVLILLIRLFQTIRKYVTVKV